MPSRLTAVVATVLIAAGSLTCGESAGPDPNAVARVVITPDTSTIDTGDSLQLSAVARNAAGDELSGKSVAWSSLDAALASVTSSGRVGARWPGVARIVATSDQRSDTSRLMHATTPAREPRWGGCRPIPHWRVWIPRVS